MWNGIFGPDWKPTDKYNQKPIFYSIKYEVELPDGVVDEYYHNVLSENLLSQVDKEGRESILMKEISDHNIDKYAIREWKKGLITKKVWKLLFEYKYRTQYCIPLKDLKGSNTVETAKYADTNNLL